MLLQIDFYGSPLNVLNFFFTELNFILYKSMFQKSHEFRISHEFRVQGSPTRM